MTADRLGVAQNVRAEEHRPPLLAQRADEVAHVAAPERIEAGQRLVQKDHLRVVEQSLRDADALQHPARVRPKPPPPLGPDAGPVEPERSPPAAFGGRIAEQSPDVREELFGRAELVEAGRLRKEPDSPADGHVAGRPAQNLGAARRRTNELHQQPQRRGLAGAVRPEIAEHRARRHVERHLVEGALRAGSPEPGAERLRERTEPNRRHRRVRRGSRRATRPGRARRAPVRRRSPRRSSAGPACP